MHACCTGCAGGELGFDEGVVIGDRNTKGVRVGAIDLPELVVELQTLLDLPDALDDVGVLGGGVCRWHRRADRCSHDSHANLPRGAGQDSSGDRSRQEGLRRAGRRRSRRLSGAQERA